jgi:hypothetical protein
MSGFSMMASNVSLLDCNALIALATPESAKLLLASISALPRHEFWPDDASHLDMPVMGIIGHKQVTDAYLALLPRKHGGFGGRSDRNHTPRFRLGSRGQAGGQLRLW